MSAGYQHSERTPVIGIIVLLLLQITTGERNTTKTSSSPTDSATLIRRTITSAEIQKSSLTTIHHVSSLRRFQVHPLSPASTKVATITRVFVVDSLLNTTSDECATIGESFRFDTYFNVHSKSDYIEWQRFGNVQIVQMNSLKNSNCRISVNPVTDLPKFSVTCISTGNVYILTIKVVTEDDIGHTWTISSHSSITSHSIPVRQCGSDDTLNTTSQECATLGESYRLRATYDFHTYGVLIEWIEWRRSDKPSEIYRQYINSEQSVISCQYHYGTTFTLYCNSSENASYLELKNITHSDLDVNWTVTTWFNVKLDPIPVTWCGRKISTSTHPDSLNSQTASYNSATGRTDTSYNSATPIPGSSNSSSKASIGSTFNSLTTRPLISYSGMTAMNNTVLISTTASPIPSNMSTPRRHSILSSSTTTNPDISVSSTSRSPATSFSRTTRSPASSVSSTISSPATSVISATRSPATSVSSTTRSPATSFSSTKRSLATSLSSTITSHSTSVISTTRSPATSFSSTTLSLATSASSTKTSPDTISSPATSVISATRSPATSVSSTTRSPATSFSSTKRSLATSLSSTITSHSTSVISTTRSPATSFSSTTLSLATSASSTKTSPDTSVNSMTTSADTSKSSLTTNHVYSIRSSPDYHLSSYSTTPASTMVATITRVFVVDSLLNTTSDECATIGESFRFGTYFKVHSNSDYIEWKRFGNVQVVRISYLNNSNCHISVYPVTDLPKFSVNCISTGNVYTLAIQVVAEDDIGHTWTISSRSTITSHSIPVRQCGSEDQLNTTSQECATLGESYRLCATYDFRTDGVLIYWIEWRRSDRPREIYRQYINSERSVISCQYHNGINYTLYCNSSENASYLEIKTITHDDLNVNWTVTTWLKVILDPIPVTWCGRIISVNKSILLSSQDTSMDPPLAVDGDLRTNASHCLCCAMTNLQLNPSVRLDLGSVHKVFKIAIYGQTDGAVKIQDFAGMTIRIGNDLVRTIPVNSTHTDFYEFAVQPMRLAQQITLTLDGWKQLVVCEILVFGDCRDLYYGENCSQECDCNGGPCNTTTGICLSACKKPTTIENGRINYYGTITNSTATYMCDVGHYLIGSNTMTCEHGSWVGSIPKCMLVDCGEPTHVAHGLVNHKATTFKTTATYTCEIGYNMTGNNVITCGEYGTWDGDKPVCLIVDCGFPRNIMNGRYTLVGASIYSSMALYKCLDGYKLSSTNDRRRCEADGIWQGEIGTCVPVACRKVSTPTDGLVAYSGDKITASFSCNSGFRLIGQNKLFCLSTGIWSEDVPKCVKVNAEIKYCQKDEDSRGTVWNETSPGQTITSLCPDDQEGTISRQCNQTGDWKLPRYSCVKKEITEAESKIDVIESSNMTEAVKAGIVSEVLDTLSTSITATVSSVNTVVGDGEIKKVTSILEKVASISQGILVTDKQSEDFIGTTSNLLNQQNSESFRSLEDNKDQTDQSSAAADRVLKVVSNFAKAIANSLDNLNGSKTIQTKNMAITVARIQEGDAIKFPLKSSTSIDMNSSTSAEMPSDALKGIRSYSGIIYNNLSGLLSSRIYDMGTSDDDNFEINAAVIDMQLLNTTGIPLNFKINLNFDKFQSGNLETKCCFWNYNRSAWDTFGCKLDTDKTNDTLTLCKCNHTTNFAILMNPYNTQNVDSKVLDYITLVGCSISMVCLIVTIVIHAALWRLLKSDRAIILINLSIALILSHATFVFGADKTEHEILCTAVAVALHYIYLVVFVLMLSEGIEIFITVVYVFAMKSRLRRLLLMSWGLPVIIVGTSMAVTQLDGYGSDTYCWMSIHSGLIWAFVGPAMAIIIANLVQLCIVIRKMFNVKSLRERSKIDKVKTGIRCLCVLLPLTGGTWVIGVFYVNKSLAWIQYTFAVLNCLQGVFILLFHCIFNSKIQSAVSRRITLYRNSTAFSKSSNNPAPRSSASTGSSSSHRHERSNDSRDLIENSFKSVDGDMHQLNEGSGRYEITHL